MPDECLLKVCLIGTSREVTKGVTQWIQTWGNYPTTAVGFNTVTQVIQIDNKIVKFIICAFDKEWTTERNRKRHYSNSSALIIVFDKGDRTSFNAVKDIFKVIPRSNVFPSGKSPIAVVGFFSASEEITTKEGQNLAKALGVDYYETEPADKAAFEGIVHDLTLKVLKRKGVLEKTITTPRSPSEQDIQEARQVHKEAIRKLIYEDQLATRIDINLPAGVPPKEVDMHKELWQEYQDPRITIRQRQNIDNEEE